MGRTFKLDKSLIRESHKWKFVDVAEHDWGVSVQFRCQNPGCPTELYVPANPSDSRLGGVCFDTSRAEVCE